MSSRRQDPFPRPGQRWAHFDVTGEVARGNMGVVFRARDVRDQRDVALKVLIVGHDDREANERFKREARSLARLSSRHIVRVHSYGVHEGIPFLTMDFVPGTTLQELLDRGALTLNRAVDLLTRIADAMDHAHSRGVLHRDLKPANVLMGADGEPRITDFGLARLDDASASLSQDGDLIGTPVYMAPEQVHGDLRALGPSTDVWALGVMLYVALTGSLPFRGKTVDEVGKRVTTEEPRPPRALRPEVPAELELVCLTALQKDWRRRYQSAGELARDLEAYLRGRPILAGRVTLAVRARRALRAARLHAGAVTVVLAALVLGAGVGLGRWMQVASHTERSAEELLVRAVQRRAAASVAITAADEAWARSDLPRTADHAQHALEDVAWAAAYLERAARTRSADGEDAPGLEAALGSAPVADEVALGVGRDPVLGALRARGRALGARAALSAASGGGPDAWVALEEGFRATGEVADLEALAAASERTGSLAAARRARAALASHGLRPAPGVAGAGRVARLLARLAELGAVAPCAACARPGRAAGQPAGVEAWTCPICEHACVAVPEQRVCSGCGLDATHADRQDDLGVAVRAALASAALRRGDAGQALSLLAGAPPAGAAGEAPEAGHTDRLRSRAEAARRLGRRAEHEAAVAALLAWQADARAVGLGWVQRGRWLLDQGWPRAARDAVDRARVASPGDEDVLASARLLDASAQAALGESEPVALRALGQDAAAPLLVRLDALRLLVLTGSDLPTGPEPIAPEPILPVVRARARLRLARAAGPAAEGLGWLAARAAGVATTHVSDGLVAAVELDLDALGRDAQLLGDPEALATVAVLRLRRSRLADDPDAVAARALARAALETSRPGPGQRAAAVVLRLAGETVTYAPPSVEPPSAALAEGRTWLGDLARAAGADQSAARERARRGLELAVRCAPFAAGPRVARAMLRLRAAGAHEDEARRPARAGALRDAAAAALLDPDDGAARATFLLALAACDAAAVAARLEGTGPALLAAERRVLERAVDLERVDWSPAPDDQAALRLADVVLRAAGRDATVREAEVRVADALHRRIDDTPSAGLESDLLFAALSLEDPTALDAWLLQQRRVVASDGEVQRAVDGEHSTAARVLEVLRTLARVPAGAAPEALAQLRVEALASLEAIARRQPGPAVASLRATIEVWTTTPGAEIADLLARPWSGALRETLRAAAGEVGVGHDGLWEHPAVRRMLSRRP